jgi:predicted component of viral defense system (DUF524 family)
VPDLQEERQDLDDQVKGKQVETTVVKSDLLAILTENRAKHRTVFEAAFAGYKDQAKKILRAHLRDLNAGRAPELRILLSRPQDHTADYDRIIKMLELDVNEQFTLPEERFAQYVMDDWRWKRDWLRMSSQYASASTQEAYGVIEDDDY